MELDTEVRDLADKLKTMDAALSRCTQSLDAVDRADARDIARLELQQRDADQIFRMREESHKAYLEEVASFIAHRKCVETIAMESAKNLGRIADALGALMEYAAAGKP